jgi:hypothetical protein
MKLKNYLFLLVMIGASVQAQVSSIMEGTTTEVLEPIDVYVTEPMWSYPQVDPMSFPEKEYPRGGMLSSKRQNKADFLKTVGESSTNVDPLIQDGGYIRSPNAAFLSFDGINSNASPPDPTGAVGPNHIVEMTNTVWAVFDKTGVMASGFPKSLSDPLGAGNGDPIVLYDREADRWLITQLILIHNSRLRFQQLQIQQEPIRYTLLRREAMIIPIMEYGATVILLQETSAVLEDFTPSIDRK